MIVSFFKDVLIKNSYPKTYQVKLPDLKVELKLTIGKHDYPDAGICDTINGDDTVTNIGDAPSGKYWIMIRSKDTTWDGMISAHTRYHH